MVLAISVTKLYNRSIFNILMISSNPDSGEASEPKFIYNFISAALKIIVDMNRI